MDEIIRVAGMYGRRPSLWDSRLLLAFFMAGSLLLGACSSTGGATGDAGSASPAADDGVGTTTSSPDGSSGAALELMTIIPVEHLDPHLNPFYGPLAPMFAIYDRLLTLDPETLELEPMLATAWEFSEDGSTLTLTLRDDVTFHDGAIFDAEAVRANIERAQTVEGSVSASSLEAIQAVEVVDPTTVRLEVGPGAAALPTVLAGQEGIMISPDAIADPERSAELGTNPGLAGSGPYVVDEFIPNERFTLQRAPDEYWGPSGGTIPTIRYTTVSDQQARVTALQTGEANMISIDVDKPELATSLESDGLNVTPYPAFLPAVLMLRPDGSLENVRVRQAIASAVNKEAISEAFYGGLCDPPAPRTLHPEGSWGNDPNAEAALPYNPEYARELLAEYGAGAGDVSFEVAIPQAYEGVATAIQAQLSEIGIGLELVTLPAAESSSEFISGTYPALASSARGNADPALTMSDLVSTYPIGNAEHAALLDDLSTEALDQTAGQAARADAVYEMNRIIEENAYVIPLCHRPFAVGTASTVGGVEDMYWPGGFDFRALTVDE